MADGRGMDREHAENLHPLLEVPPRGQRAAQDNLLALVVPIGTELRLEAALGSRRGPSAGAGTLTKRERPPREGARNVDHILLRVAAVHAERVQLEELTS